MPGGSAVIRPINRNERADWQRLWQAYLSFYAASQEARDTDVTWARLHDPDEPMFALGACLDGQLLGIVHFLFHRTFWTAQDSCYLQDLFVAETARGLGLGRALIAAVVDKALEANAGRVYWLTQEDNHVARALYDKVAERSGFVQYRIRL